MKRGLDRRTSLQAWQTHYERSLRLYERLVNPEHLIFLKYEDLVRDLPGQLSRMCQYLGHQFEPEMVDFRNKQHHIANGNAMRFGNSEIRLDEAWRSGLKSGDLAYFNSRAGFLNERLGYGS